MNATGKKLCLNMIVKNEMANLPRCLGAVADHIGCWVIGDTGSSDGTQDFIRSFFAERGLPGELHSFPFINFEQARNEALDRAYASNLTYDYLLFDDADMELVVEDPEFRSSLVAPGYHLIQRAGSGLAYWNTRLVRREVGARYHGVTHEYLNVPGETQRLQGVCYKDHASGANRVDKFERDARLLTEALRQDPDNARYWFYLAQSYRDAGRTREAVEAYAKRAGMGGWDEEAWNARLQEARCLRTLNDEDGFLRTALAAFNQRPHRAEPLYDLARYYREHGMNDASLLFSEAGLALPRPEQDTLFIEDFVYTTGLREEFSIAANYARDKERKDRGHVVCNSLALGRDVPRGTRNLARWNLFYYIEPLGEMLPSFTKRRLNFVPAEGYRPSPPSVAMWGDKLLAIQGAVHYEQAPDGVSKTAGVAPGRTRNFLLSLSASFDIESATEILPPADMARPAPGEALGFKDARLFVCRDELWCSAIIHDSTSEGWSERIVARIDRGTPNMCRLTDWRVVPPQGPRPHEKNWIPLIEDAALRFIYGCDPIRVVNEQDQTVLDATPDIAADSFRGGSPAIAFDGGWLALIHEVRTDNGKQCYQQRFVWFDSTYMLRRTSLGFYFETKGAEHATGLAWGPDHQRLLISYGVDNGEAFVATVEAAHVRNILLDANGWTPGDPAVSNQEMASGAECDVPVRSFDLFDTLVARRCVDAHLIFALIEQRSGFGNYAAIRSESERQVSSGSYTLDNIYAQMCKQFDVSPHHAARLKALELELEFENILPIQEHCLQVRRDDLIISDMYLPETFLRRILTEKCNLTHNPLFVSSNGKRSGEVWRTLRNRLHIAEHIGDNVLTDVEMPRQHGITARLTRISARTEMESMLADAGCIPLANAIREARLTTWHPEPKMRQAQIAQIEYNFPFLFLTSLNLVKLLHKNGWQSLLFSGRDCVLLYRLFDQIAAELNLQCSSHYFYTSRIARARASSSYQAYLGALRGGRKSVIIDLCGTGWSLARLITETSAPETDIFLVHRIILPHLFERYRQYGDISDEIPISSLVQRGPNAGDNDVLEELNRAQHPMVEDVTQIGSNFLPVYSPIQYDRAKSGLIDVHHRAFMIVLNSLVRFRREDYEHMTSAAQPELLEAVYGRMATLLPQVADLMDHKQKEEAQVWLMLERQRSAATNGVGFGPA